MVSNIALALRFSGVYFIALSNRYDAMWADKGGPSVHALKDIDAHAQRRRYWDKAMTGTPQPASDIYTGIHEVSIVSQVPPSKTT